jgi:hypothetical protein
LQPKPHTDDLARVIAAVLANSAGASTKVLEAALAECFAQARRPNPLPPQASIDSAPDEDRVADSVDEFCARYRIGRSKLYQQWRDGIGPRFFKVGIAKRISRQAGLDWIKAREAATAQVPVEDDAAA